MNELIKVAGHDGLARDVSSGAILNTSKSEYEQYVLRRDSNLKRQEQINRHDRDINIIKEDIAEIKALLLSIYRN